MMFDRSVDKKSYRKTDSFFSILGQGRGDEIDVG